MLKEGSTVIYKRTGTFGKVVELKEMDGKVWAKLDSTGLFYDEDFLELVADEGKVESGPKLDLEKREEKRVSSETIEMKGEGRIDTSGDVCGAG
jgi:hypothetical protein